MAGTEPQKLQLLILKKNHQHLQTYFAEKLAVGEEISELLANQLIQGKNHISILKTICEELHVIDASQILTELKKREKQAFCQKEQLRSIFDCLNRK